MIESLPHRVTLSPEVLVQRIDDETVLLDLDAGVYYGLDTVATEMWEALATSADVKDARDHLIDTFEVEPAELERDLAAFIDDLARRGLLGIPDDA